jgi:hypothetical protein
MLAQVMEILAPGVPYTSNGTPESVVFENEPGDHKIGIYIPVYNDILHKLTNVEAIKKMREERNALLDQSDKYVIIDYPHRLELDIQNWVDYRQALRNLPTTARPTLDEDGKLKDVVWPTVPTLSF